MSIRGTAVDRVPDHGAPPRRRRARRRRPGRDRRPPRSPSTAPTRSCATSPARCCCDGDLREDAARRRAAATERERALRPARRGRGQEGAGRGDRRAAPRAGRAAAQQRQGREAEEGRGRPPPQAEGAAGGRGREAAPRRRARRPPRASRSRPRPRRSATASRHSTPRPRRSQEREEALIAKDEAKRLGDAAARAKAAARPASHTRRGRGRMNARLDTLPRMRALVIPRTGPPEVLQVEERPDPQPGPGQVRVEVKAAGINFADLMARQGLYPDAPKLPAVVGYEFAGDRRVARRRRRPSYEVGQRVLGGCRFGGYAELVVDGRGEPRPAARRLELRGGRRAAGQLRDRVRRPASATARCARASAS